MHPKNTGDDALPNFKAIGDREVEAILMSHAHQDHIGTLALAMRRFPGTQIFMTEATAEVGSVLLHNSVNVMTRQREEIGEMSYPLFTHREIDRRVRTLALVVRCASEYPLPVNGRPRAKKTR
jgi:Cft2 family RNA processing exonuclease